MPDSLPEYKNLTQDELDMADHYAEIGDMAALRRFQELSANRKSRTAVGSSTYCDPMRPRRVQR